ncbi:hypothetical protein PFLUV_G00122560 [Perca fluviatilis]|uniref:Uncharacterized protein n=1 Tax=Perca fluviatilis TaxID=8168 RepID=A0A6A5ERG0_PERFL|nr:hypothetical protein PFLUV_G00122560 [Perca fluviatilis]
MKIWRNRLCCHSERCTVCDSVDPLGSHDDSCHVLILHDKVSETPGNTANLSQSDAATHQVCLNYKTATGICPLCAAGVAIDLRQQT